MMTLNTMLTSICVKLEKKRDNKNLLKINGCMKLHMTCFSPNGNMTAKVNFCSCDACVKGKFLKCLLEKGLHFDERQDH